MMNHRVLPAISDVNQIAIAANDASSGLSKCCGCGHEFVTGSTSKFHGQMNVFGFCESCIRSGVFDDESLQIRRKADAEAMRIAYEQFMHSRRHNLDAVKDRIYEDHLKGLSVDAISEARGSSVEIIQRSIDDRKNEDDEYSIRFGKDWNVIGRNIIGNLEKKAIFCKEELEDYLLTNSVRSLELGAFSSGLMQHWLGID